jgi:hypothetical protein
MSAARATRRAFVLAFGLSVPASLAHAQQSVRPCDGLTVSVIEVDPQRPEFRGVLAWWRKFARALGLHHETTDEDLIRRFVSLDPGLPCTEFRRSESERILRVQPFLADASVTTTRHGDSVRVRVQTVDEVPVVVSGRASGAELRALNIGTMNFLGNGLHVEGRWEQYRERRQGFGGKIAHPQLFGRPYAIVAEGMRRTLGEHYSLTAAHPFYTDLQRIAWHTGISVAKDFVGLRRQDDRELVQPVDRSMWNVGGVLRLGPPRRLVLVGGMLLGERVVPRHQFSFVDSTTGLLVATADTAGVRRYDTYDAVHVAGVLGIRALTFSRMRGLDALDAEQDVGTGLQVGGALGTQPWVHDSPLRDAFASADIYAGTRTRRNFMAARLEAESRVDLERQEWEHIIASGRAAWYFQPRPRWTSELSLEAAGGWRTILPFQLELGERRGGLRGYERSREPGAQRALLRLEQRLDLGRYQRTRAAYGVGVFTEAGRVWAGDVPFGMTTPVRTSVGLALLGAIPARSQRTLRAEIAVPLTRAQGARTELRFSVREPARGFWFDPPRIRWARLSALPEQIFTWP